MLQFTSTMKIFQKTTAVLIVMFLIVAILLSMKPKRTEAYYVQVFQGLIFGYSVMCSLHGLNFICKGQGRKTLQKAGIWISKYAPKAIDYAQKKIKNIASKSANKNRGIWGTTRSIVVRSPSIILDAIYGIDLKDAQEEMLLPEYYKLINSIHENSKKVKSIQSDIWKKEVKKLRTKDDDNIIIVGFEFDNPTTEGADDIKKKLDSLSNELNLLRNETSQKYKELSNFLSSYYGIKIKVIQLKQLIGRADGQTILETVVMFRAARMIVTKLEAEKKQYPDNSEIAEQHLSTVVLMQDIVANRLKVFGENYETKWVKKLETIKTKLEAQIEKNKPFANNKRNKSRNIYKNLIKEHRSLVHLANQYATILKQQSKAIKETIKTLEERVNANLAQLQSKKLAREYYRLVRKSTAEYKLIQKLSQPKIFVFRSKKDRNRIDKLTHDIM